MKTFNQLIYWRIKRSLCNFPPSFNMITNLPDSVLCLIDTYNGCHEKYNLLVCCKATYQALLPEPNNEYRSHFIPRKMLKMSFVPLRSPSHCLLPTPSKNQVVNGFMNRGMISLSHACFHCCHYLPFTAFMLPTLYDCIVDKAVLKPMPLDHKCFFNRHESATKLLELKNTTVFQPDDASIVAEIFRFELKNTNHYNKSVVQICDEGCLNTVQDIVEMGIGTEKHHPTAVISHKILKVVRHSNDLAIIKFQITFFLTPELELRCSFLSSSNLLDTYSINVNPNAKGTKPFYKSFTYFAFVDPNDEDIGTVAELYNVAILHQRKNSYNRLDIHSPYIYMGMYSLPASLRGPREEKLDIISLYDDDGESFYPLMVLTGNHVYEELRYHYHCTFKNESLESLPPSILSSFYLPFGGNEYWSVNIQICKHNVHEIFYKAVLENVRDHVYVHYGLSCIDHAVIRISDSHFLHVNIPHMQCDELLSTDSEYNTTDGEYSESGSDAENWMDWDSIASDNSDPSPE